MKAVCGESVGVKCILTENFPITSPILYINTVPPERLSKANYLHSSEIRSLYLLKWTALTSPPSNLVFFNNVLG